jgi:hypothetical protein
MGSKEMISQFQCFDLPFWEGFFIITNPPNLIMHSMLGPGYQIFKL